MFVGYLMRVPSLWKKGSSMIQSIAGEYEMAHTFPNKGINTRLREGEIQFRILASLVNDLFFLMFLKSDRCKFVFSCYIFAYICL